MATLTYNADSAEVSVFSGNATKVGSTYVKDDASDVVLLIESDAGANKALDFSTSAESLSAEVLWTPSEITTGAWYDTSDGSTITRPERLSASGTINQAMTTT